MRRTILKYAATLALASAAAALPLLAQVNSGVSTTPGNADPAWNVEWTGLGGGNNLAYSVSPTPGPWANTTPNSFWIGATPTASLTGGSGDNVERVSYDFSQVFYSASTGPIQMTVWTDNFFHSFTFNSTTYTVPPGDVSMPPGDFASSARVYTLDPVVGYNNLNLYTTGDGQTDAVNVAFSSVPEPSSMALLGTGLIGLVPMIRRKRKA